MEVNVNYMLKPNNTHTHTHTHKRKKEKKRGYDSL